MPKQASVDVVVIGAGGAGMMAAIAARDAGSDVLLISKGPLGKAANTAISAGIFNAVGCDYPLTKYLDDIYRTGKGINDPQLAELLAKKSVASLEALKQRGVHLKKVRTGFRIPPQCHPGTLPGLALTSKLACMVNETGCQSLSGFHAFKLLVQNGRVRGVQGVEATGEEVVIAAPAIVLATGGGGALYMRHDNAAAITGDGYAMALQAGCRLQDMEFVQFYPIGLCEPTLPETMVHPPYPAKARILDATGRDVLEELGDFKNLNQAITQLRDKAAQLFFKKHQEGGLFLDLRDVPEEEWQQNWALKMLDRYRFDFRNHCCRIAPLVHFFMGGVTVGDAMQTDIAGLFAAGEVVGGLHGANRLGGNALTECIVEGEIAGRGAAEWARQAGRDQMAFHHALPLIPGGLDASRKVRAEFRAAFRQLKQVAWNYAGIVRQESGLRHDAELLARLEKDVKLLTPVNQGEFRAYNQICNGLLVLHCILEASLIRKESRGAFFRSDYPDQDDSHWCCNIYISMNHNGRLVLDRGATLEPVRDAE